MPLRGDRLEALRTEKGLTQEELGDHIFCNRKQVGRWEHGKQDPTGDFLARLAQEFEVSVDYLLGLTDQRHHYLTMNDLTPDEGELIAARRSGNFKTALNMLGNQIAKKIQPKPRVSGRKPKVK